MFDRRCIVENVNMENDLEGDEENEKGRGEGKGRDVELKEREDDVGWIKEWYEKGKRNESGFKGIEGGGFLFEVENNGNGRNDVNEGEKKDKGSEKVVKM